MEPEEQRIGFEEQLRDLEGIVTQLEGGSLSLEHSLAAFEQGVGLVRQLMTRLDDVERRVEVLLREERDGVETLTLQELDEEDS
jgi:exodeoxyribonuclease VII small subunit